MPPVARSGEGRGNRVGRDRKQYLCRTGLGEMEPGRIGGLVLTYHVRTDKNYGGIAAQSETLHNNNTWDW